MLKFFQKTPKSVDDASTSIQASPNINIGSLVLLLLWHILHAIVNLWCFVRRVYHVLESSLIDNGYLKMYRDLNLDSLHNLAIVVDSEEAHKTSEIIQLLQWVAAIGVRNVCLYDTKGVLKKSKEIILEKLCVPKVSEDVTTQLLEQKDMNLEFASLSDGKEAVARAANVLLAKHYLGGETAPLFTESHVAEALTAVGSGGPNPELLLVYGPVRCHQGFPSWRIRYTEIIHMGPLDSMNHGSLIKAMWKFSNVHQNYGKIKINCDGNKLGKFGHAGYGGVLRDEDGLWIKGYMGHLGHSSILEAELWGIHRGLIIIYGLNLRDVIIETDCQEAAKSIQEEAEEGFPYGMMVQNIRDLLARCNAVVKVIPREINGVADFLAKKGREQKETLVILEEPPSDLHDLLIQDMIHCSSKCN